MYIVSNLDFLLLLSQYFLTNSKSIILLEMHNLICHYIFIPIVYSTNSTLSTPIYDKINLPKEFISKGLFVIECYNYPDSDADFEFNPTTNILEVDPGLSLTTETTDFLTPPIENDIFSFVHNNLIH